MSRNYPRLGIEDFGSHLLETADLDPIYVALQRMKLPPDRLAKWLVAYWCFYSAGVACHMSEQGDNYWGEMLRAARNTEPAPHGGRWERGKERRHFRGAQGLAAVQYLIQRYQKPDDMLQFLTDKVLTEKETFINGSEDAFPAVLPFCVVSYRIKQHQGFGDWIAFKIGDMLERVVGVPVDFEESEVFMFDTPKKAAYMLFDQAFPDQTDAQESVKIKYAIERLKGYFGPRTTEGLTRPLGLQEFETILCKWKSHMSGHYPLGNDIREISEGLKPWIKCCPTAERFAEAMPK